MKRIWNFIKDEDGLELTEYAVIGAMIILAIVVTILFLGAEIEGAFNRLATIINTNPQ